MKIKIRIFLDKQKPISPTWVLWHHLHCAFLEIGTEPKCTRFSVAFKIARVEAVLPVTKSPTRLLTSMRLLMPPRLDELTCERKNLVQ